MTTTFSERPLVSAVVPPPPSLVRTRKKIGILTFHRCINYGAYWQTRCLADFFSQSGHDVEVLDYWSRGQLSNELGHALRPVRPAPRSDVMPLLAKTLKFVRAQQRMKRTPFFSHLAPPDFSDFDLIAIGSDEVWNLSHPWLGGWPLFFGENLAPRRLVSYGASFGNYDAANGLAARWVKCLARFDEISVRDVNSAELIQRHLGRSAALVLDPCLQVIPVAQGPGDAQRHPPYLLVYGTAFGLDLIAEARAWAKTRGLRIVSIGYRNDWADLSLLGAGPDDFVRTFKNASAVITSFLHGCIFSLQFRRPFVVQRSAYRANKIVGLLRIVGAEHRAHDPRTPGRLGELLDAPIETDVLAAIAGQRAESAKFLASCLQ